MCLFKATTIVLYWQILLQQKTTTTIIIHTICYQKVYVDCSVNNKIADGIEGSGQRSTRSNPPLTSYSFAHTKENLNSK